MLVLITGATGFLGSHIAEMLVREKHQVRCLVRPSGDLSFLKTLESVEFVYGALNDGNSLQAAVEGVDAVIHNAGLTSAKEVKDFYHTNVDGTVALLKAVKRYAPKIQRFVFVSSLAAAGPAAVRMPLSDTVIPAPVSHYGRSKLMAENKAKEFAEQIPITIVRPPLIYGPRDKNMLVFFKTIHRGLSLMPLGGRTNLSTIYVVDAASAILKAMTSGVPSGSTYFIDDGKMHQWSELASKLAATISRRILIQIPIPLFLMKMIIFFSELYGQLMNKSILISKDKISELKQLHWICESRKARRELDWTHQFDWESGVKLTYAWYKESGWL